MLDPKSLVGETLEDTYRLVRFIGSGGFGWVYEAKELLLGQEMGTCALKLVRCANDEETRAFLGEVRAVAALDHPNIIRFRAARHITSGPLKGCLCLCMELAEECLEERMLAQKVLHETAVTEIGLAIAEGLLYLHGRKMIHRDLKPGNIFRVGTQWKLGDLGLAQTVKNSAARTTQGRGTLMYASPEVFNGQVGSFCDMWAFGVLLHEMLTGTPPFRDGTDVEVMSQIANGSPQISPHIGPPYDAVIQGCMARDRTLRWAVDRARGVLATRGPALGSAPAASVISSTPAASALGRNVQATPPAPTRAMTACTGCGASNGASDPVCCQCGRVMGGATDPGYLAVKYRLGRDMQDKGHLPEALKHFQQILALAPGYADVVQRVAEIEAQMRATAVVRAQMVLTPLWNSELKNVYGSQFSLRFSADGHLVVASHDGVVGIFILADGTATYRLTLSCYPQSMAISPSCQLLATVESNDVRLWEVASGAEMSRYHVDASRGCEFSSDGVYLLTTDALGTHSMHVASGAKQQITHPTRGVITATLSPNREKVLYLGRGPSSISPVSSRVPPNQAGGLLELWCLNEGRRLSTVSCAGDAPICLSDTMHAAVQGMQNTIDICDMGAGEVLRSLDWINTSGYVACDVNVRQLSFHPSGGHVAVVVRGERLPDFQVREVDSGRTIWDAPSLGLTAVEFSPDGRYLAAAHGGRHSPLCVRVWKVDFQ